MQLVHWVTFRKDFQSSATEFISSVRASKSLASFSAICREIIPVNVSLLIKKNIFTLTERVEKEKFVVFNGWSSFESLSSDNFLS